LLFEILSIFVYFTRIKFKGPNISSIVPIFVPPFAKSFLWRPRFLSLDEDYNFPSIFCLFHQSVVSD